VRCFLTGLVLWQKTKQMSTWKTGTGKMRLVRPPASGASMSSNVCKPNPSCNQNHRRDPDLNPVSYAVAVCNPNYTRFTIRTRCMCPVRLCLVTSLTITLTNPNPPSDTHHDPSHIQAATPNPKPALTILDAPDAGGRTRRILSVRCPWKTLLLAEVYIKCM